MAVAGSFGCVILFFFSFCVAADLVDAEVLLRLVRFRAGRLNGRESNQLRGLLLQ